MSCLTLGFGQPNNDPLVNESVVETRYQISGYADLSRSRKCQGSGSADFAEQDFRTESARTLQSGRVARFISRSFAIAPATTAAPAGSSGWYATFERLAFVRLFPFETFSGNPLIGHLKPGASRRVPGFRR